MDEKLQELLQELYKELNGEVNIKNTDKTISQQSTNQTQQVEEQPQEEPEDATVNQEQPQIAWDWDYWKQIGRSVFLNMATIMNPNIIKYMPVIEQRAEYKLQQDLAKNQVKETYLHYLQEAYNDVQRELAGILKDFLQSPQVGFYGYMAPSKQEAPTYTMKDYKNDYKKALEYATYKGMGEIYYKDSSEKGKYGEGKLLLGESIDEINI
jgi:hypothetical protein